MILQIDGWKFRIFDTATRKYYAHELSGHCTCAWCRNFYQTVDDAYPDLRSLLNRFGVHIEAPEEMIAPTPTLCDCYYTVCGEILERGEESISVNGITVEPLTWEEAMVNTDMQEPCFFLHVGCMQLPWVLDEPMEETESPAKGKKFIQRILSRWITDET